MRRITFFVFVAVAVVYWLAVRRWFARWGTTRDERTRVMAGDAIIPDPTDVATHAVTINAPPQDIWPWLVQMGYQRGGLYFRSFSTSPPETRFSSDRARP